jgi:hypothetical protein
MVSPGGVDLSHEKLKVGFWSLIFQLELCQQVQISMRCGHRFPIQQQIETDIELTYKPYEKVMLLLKDIHRMQAKMSFIISSRLKKGSCGTREQFQSGRRS